MALLFTSTIWVVEGAAVHGHSVENKVNDKIRLKNFGLATEEK